MVTKHLSFEQLIAGCRVKQACDAFLLCQGKIQNAENATTTIRYRIDPNNGDFIIEQHCHGCNNAIVLSPCEVKLLVETLDRLYGKPQKEHEQTI